MSIRELNKKQAYILQLRPILEITNLFYLSYQKAFLSLLKDSTLSIHFLCNPFSHYLNDFISFCNSPPPSLSHNPVVCMLLKKK